MVRNQFVYLFRFGSVVSQDREGEKIGDRPTHPGAVSLSTKMYYSAKNEETHNDSHSLQC